MSTLSPSRRVALVLVGLLSVAVLAGCGNGERATTPPSPVPASTTPPVAESPRPATLRLTSAAFSNGEPIPARYSCHGANVPPRLDWAGVPEDAGELALVVDDPDAVGGLYVHWVVVGIEPGATGSISAEDPAGGRILPNSGGEAKYLGPCPPAGTGTHHYRFTLYVLPGDLDIKVETPAKQSTEAIAKAATATARLVGTYEG